MRAMSFDFRNVPLAWIEAKLCGDGQAFTEYVRRLLRDYIVLGTGTCNWSANANSFTKDGGIDGVIDDGDWSDPLGLLEPKCVLQFKAGETSPTSAQVEIEKEPKDGKARIADLIAVGY